MHWKGGHEFIYMQVHKVQEVTPQNISLPGLVYAALEMFCSSRNKFLSVWYVVQVFPMVEVSPDIASKRQSVPPAPPQWKDNNSPHNVIVAHMIIYKIIFLNKIMNLKLMNLNMIQILSLLLLTERIIILLTILLLFNSLSFPPGSLMRYACIVGAGEVVWVKMWQSYWLADGRVGFRVCVAEQR